MYIIKRTQHLLIHGSGDRVSCQSGSGVKLLNDINIIGPCICIYLIPSNLLTFHTFYWAVSGYLFLLLISLFELISWLRTFITLHFSIIFYLFIIYLLSVNCFIVLFFLSCFSSNFYSKQTLM